MGLQELTIAKVVYYWEMEQAGVKMGDACPFDDLTFPSMVRYFELAEMILDELDMIDTDREISA